MTLAPKHQVEALLFSSGKTMSEEQLTLLTRLEKSVVKRALKALKKDYEGRDSAVTLSSEGNEWKMTVRNDYLPLVKNIVADTELSRSCMETLAVIAYRYPKVLQSEVINVRGSGAYEHIGELEDLGFINRAPSGRSYRIKLTEKFFEYFDVPGEKDIKKVFKDIKMPSKEEQKKLGEMEVVGVDPLTRKKTGDMEVVDVTDKPEKPEVKEAPPEEEIATDQQHKDFLDDLDKRISEISQKNDEREQDKQLKRVEEDISDAEEIEQKD